MGEEPQDRSVEAVRPGEMTALLQALAATPPGTEVEHLPLAPGTVIGRFELLREVGRGGLLAVVGRVAEAEAPAYQAAQAHAWRGERDDAFRWLERGLEIRDPGMNYLLFDPLLRSLRSDPRYEELRRRMRLPDPAGGGR